MQHLPQYFKLRYKLHGPPPPLDDSDDMLDFIDDDILDHTPLDARVYEKCGSDHTKDPSPLPYVLAVIASSTPDKLDPKFRDIDHAAETVERYSTNSDGNENENLSKLLDWCWRQGSFEKIRRLSECCSMNLLFQAISQRTAEILRPVPVSSGQATWEQCNRYTQSFFAGC